ncbi:MAG: hypothetical protein LQ337_005950 [Flavoplaca oasis]|nr:MAG: hypothetical protein LQ337_005950 [Flavoplaca oasis]
MPSLFTLDMPRSLPLTPPDYYDTCLGNSARPMYQSTHGNFQSYSSVQHDPQDLQDRTLPSHFRQKVAPPAYHPFSKNNDCSVGAGMHSQESRYFGPAAHMNGPLLPPIRRTELPSNDICHSQPKPAPPAKEEKATGGVSAHLDYEMDQMAEFVAEMAQGMYDLYESRICLADIDILRSVKPKASVAPAFRKYVLSVLSSTRLPSSTILLALHYLTARMSMLSSRGRYPTGRAQVYHMLTIALLLGSKFLDDNTFQNRSWSEVSNISVSELNTLEVEWLVAISWDLHVDHEDPQGFALWRNHWQRWQAKRVEMSLRSLKLGPLDVNIQRLPPASNASNPSLSVSTAMYNDENRRSFALNDVSPNLWHAARPNEWPIFQARTEYSPPSAPDTGPATPECYGNFADNSFAHLPKPGSGRAPQSASQGRFTSYLPAPYSMAGAPSYVGQNWNGHFFTCSCMSCVPYSNQYVVGRGYGLQSVMG